MTMTERENLEHVLAHDGKAQWVPVGPDCYHTITPSPVADRPPAGEDTEDWFGVRWIYDPVSNSHMVDHKAGGALTDITEWRDQVKFPDLDAYDWEAAAAEDLKDYDRSEKMLRIKTESGPFERITQLMGYEEAYVAMYEEPEAFLELIQAIADFRIDMGRRIAKYYKPDLYMTMDDLGSSNGPLMSLETYQELIKPADKRVIAQLLEDGVVPVYHSDGRMQIFLPDLVEMGAKVINPWQGELNDQAEMQEIFGDSLVFENGMDNLVTLETASEEEIRTEVRRVIDIMWPKQNLVLALPYILPEKNREIILDEARRYGGSPKAQCA